jgi:NifU-like protein involved in Fe-S cluster formation
MKVAHTAIHAQAAPLRRNKMIDAVYNAKILGFAGNIGRSGRLENPHATAKAHSKLCGSTVLVDLCMENGVVTDFAHDVKACALGQASSAIMAQHVVGSTAEELRLLRQTMNDMLKESGTPPEGRFEDLKYLEPVRDYKARHASTLLTFDAVVDAIDQIERAASDKAA